MHPVLTNRRRLALYLFTWTLLAILIALLLIEPGRRGIPPAVLLTLPPTLLYAFACLAAWYPVRAMPLERANAWTMLVSHAFAAMVLSSVWLTLFRYSARISSPYVEGGESAVTNHSAALFVTGALLYLLAVAFHYLLVAIERAARVEKQEIEVRMLAREAELKTLKAQIDPHFLYNSLNAISALCGSNPATARTLTTLLAEYLRKSLRTGSAESITLSEELELASSYLAIERIRFGPRLELAQEIDESVRGFRVPPLLLQPLVENAVKHGIAQLVDGGTLQITAARKGARVRISVENRCDPDRVEQHGQGIGLQNTRRRVETFYGPAARVEIVEEPAHFRVALVLPA
ncbi:MAG TPA: histidine kinase [Thermoanaerobaculia bacterium]|nr:histidine kinase [Thermoanaerobaculia bacterium]